MPVISGAALAAGAGLAACCLVASLGGDGAVLAFAVPAAVAIPCAGFGTLSARRRRSTVLRPRDGFAAVAAAWLVAAAIGAVRS